VITSNLQAKEQGFFLWRKEENLQCKSAKPTKEVSSMNTALQLHTAADHLKESPWLQEKRVSTLLKSVLVGKTNFNSLEKELFTIAREYLIQMLAAFLEHLDRLILYSAERDRGRKRPGLDGPAPFLPLGVVPPHNSGSSR